MIGPRRKRPEVQSPDKQCGDKQIRCLPVQRITEVGLCEIVYVRHWEIFRIFENHSRLSFLFSLSPSLSWSLSTFVSVFRSPKKGRWTPGTYDYLPVIPSLGARGVKTVVWLLIRVSRHSHKDPSSWGGSPGIFILTASPSTNLGSDPRCRMDPTEPPRADGGRSGHPHDLGLLMSKPAIGNETGR